MLNIVRIMENLRRISKFIGNKGPYVAINFELPTLLSTNHESKASQLMAARCLGVNYAQVPGWGHS